jgi:hypothetical protein
MMLTNTVQQCHSVYQRQGTTGNKNLEKKNYEKFPVNSKAY